MTQEIFDSIYRLKLPEKIGKRFWSRLKQYWDYDDYVQEMYLILLELPEEKVNSLFYRGELADYFSKICFTQITNNSSYFHRLIEGRLETISIDDLIKKIENEDKEDE